MHRHGSNAFTSRYQPFWIEGGAATPLAKYEENGKVSMAVRKYPKWTSVYLAAPDSRSSALLNCGKPGQPINMNGHFISLHGMRSGNYVFHLPPGVRRVLDPDTGKVVAQGVQEFTIPVEAQNTYWFLLK